ncbi:MAG: type III restriction endonuclease subunit R [Ktedonobacter sp. 13_2_20CM_2_54_8]|nr:MAG: type III restriction endonuclease subunit R [Ktedonobacter sp. 13_2_20CM_2_54_8]
MRGRDLTITPPAELLELPTPTLLDSLFGPYLPKALRAKMGRDKRFHFLRTQPIHFSAVKQALRQQQIPFTVVFEERPTLPFSTALAIEPRPYQEDALTAWLAQGSAGVVVLPTGAGKTFVAAMAIVETGLWTLASAALYPRELSRFGLLIFDECHHLPAPTYRLIAESAFTPLRLGLSATPERSDMAHVELDELIGPEVYRRSPAELTEGRYLAQYQEKIIDIALSGEDEIRYAEQRRIYSSFLRRRRIVIRSPEDFQQKLIFLSARDPEARTAMLAWREARQIAMNAPAKYSEIERLLHKHAADQVLLFSEYNPVVDQISRRFCLPSITYKTPTEERRTILDRFRTGQYTKLVTGRVLNEGVDVPDCRIAIIVSGNSTKREYIQRLGRILRPKEGEALLYELVTTGTTEEEMAKRRKE